jgi:hypothetical protein
MRTALPGNGDDVLAAWAIATIPAVARRSVRLRVEKEDMMRERSPCNCASILP